MDPHSEMEVKFRAQTLDFSAFVAFVAKRGAAVRSYKRVEGQDTYWQRGANVVRHRCDGNQKSSVLTVKGRKSTESIVDRHEVDLPLAQSVRSRDVVRFLEMTGWQPQFTIEKVSYIFHVDGYHHAVCLALYDVWPPNQPEHDAGTERFLEIEVEKDSQCSPEQAGRVLAEWTQAVRCELHLGEPLNESLYEMYGPRPEPESI